MPKKAPVHDRLYGPLARGFGHRIGVAVQRLRSKTDAAEVMGLSTDQLANILAERSVPNFAAICALAQRSKTNLYWLAFGLTPQFEGDVSTRKSFSESAEDEVRISSVDGYRQYEFPQELLKPLAPYDSTQLAVLAAPGEAMEPAISRDDLLIVDRRATRTADGEIFAFNFAGDHVVRRTQRQPDGTLMLLADNPNFAAMRLDEGASHTVTVIGRVVWIGGPI